MLGCEVTRQRRRCPAVRAMPVVVTMGAVLSGCGPWGGPVEPETLSTVAMVPEVTATDPARSPDAIATPWCTDLLNLDDESITPERVITVYRAVADDAPDELAVNLRIVADAMAAGESPADWVLVPTTTVPPSTTTSSANSTIPADTGAADASNADSDSPEPGPDAEVRAPDLEPSERIAAYLNEHCRGVASTPETVDAAEFDIDVATTLP